MSIHVSWTDGFFLTVLSLSTLMMVRGLKKTHIRQAMQYIFQQATAVSASIILVIFLVIAVFDSIHMRTNDSLIEMSLLDQVLAPLGEVYEQTYSAPLSLTLYTKQMRFDGTEAKQIFPKLSYSTRHIKNQDERRQFIQRTLMRAMLWSLLVFTVPLGCQWYRKKPLNQIVLTIAVTSGLCVGVMLTTYGLSRELHVLGTGQIGQDVFYYAVKSIRTGLVIGILTTLLMMPVALFAGISAGYFGGVMDDIIQYIYTTLSSIPGVLLITASVLSMQTYIANHPNLFPTLSQSADARLLALCAILGVTSWTSLCRLLRAETLKLREIDFVLAAQALGTRSWIIMMKHILPNVMHIVMITVALDFSFLVLAEAVLSYVGVGVSPMTMSWGNMINSARLELARDPLVWWPMTAAFLFMFTLVLASNVFADAVRNAFDPHRSYGR